MRRWLPFHRFLGILTGLAGVTIGTVNGVTVNGIAPLWLVAACCAPVLLAITNIYRERAMPHGVSPLILAAGTLLSQSLLFLPIALLMNDGDITPAIFSGVGLAIICLCAVTALSYVLTFELYRRTDGVGFSQVGYFVTLSGTAAGALFFDEPMSLWFFLAVFLLFMGVAITNGHFSFVFKQPDKS